MAKKQSISYGPDSALIRGEADVARSQAMLSSAGGTAFAQGLTGAVISGIQEQEKRNSIRDAYLDDLGGIDNIYKLEDGFNKEQVSAFVRSKKDEYAKAVDCFARTKDQGCREQMEEIKFSFQNLNAQLDAYMNDKIQYNTAYDQGQIVDLKDDDKYTYMYTNNSDFSIESNGDIGFTSNGKYDRYKDVIGKWNTRQYKTEANALQAFSNATERGERGKNFFRDDVKNAFVYELQQSGTRGIQVMAKTDLTGDNQYVLGKDKDGKPILSGNQSFEAMWNNGYLDEKFYQEIPKGSDISWMDKKENSNLLANMIAEYHTDVANYYHNKGRSVFNTQQLNDRLENIKVADYLLESESKASTINNVISRGITLEGLQSITIDPKLSREIQALENGTFQVIDSQGQPTIIDPNKPEQARSILYNLAEVRSVHRISTSGGADDL